jgi:hypothetical protein
MATTMKVKNGDVVLNGTTGRPKLIGNVSGENDTTKSKEKAVQDLQRCLSINRVTNGTGAAISELVGVVSGSGGFSSISILVSNRIRGMFSAILAAQRKSQVQRSDGERFRAITFLQVLPNANSKTDYKFRLDTKTFSNKTIVQSGTLVLSR